MTNPYFSDVLDMALQSIFPALTMKISKYKYYSKRTRARDNGNVQSHDQGESKLNSAINTNSGAHTLTHDKIMKISFIKNNVATIKR